MNIISISYGISDQILYNTPWLRYSKQLNIKHCKIDHKITDLDEIFSKACDLLIIYHDINSRNLDHYEFMSNIAEYRARFNVKCVIVNHFDNCRIPNIVPYWRENDIVLFRTPPYNRLELYPYQQKKIFAWEYLYGSPRFSNDNIIHKAGFIGSDVGPDGYRKNIANVVKKVGIGICDDCSMMGPDYNKLLSQCRIIVCPEGNGPQSSRHWDVWLSKKVVLTDRNSSSVELVPGVKLLPDVHYLVYDDVDNISDIVNELSKDSDKLDVIAMNGYSAVSTCDQLSRLRSLFYNLNNF